MLILSCSEGGGDKGFDINVEACQLRQTHE